MKNLTDFRKTVETGVDPRLSIHKSKAEEMHFQFTSRTKLKGKKLVFCLTHPLIFKTCDKAIEKKKYLNI